MLVNPDAPGRLATVPVAIVDIGSNSVRLVAYEALSRALTPILNEKVLCGLGKGVATTGLLSRDAIDKALDALRCFRVMCGHMGIENVVVLATAATRDARNGADFLALARAAIGADIVLIGGLREAELSAKGVISGFHEADGIVGDLGGGSLELADVSGHRIGSGVSMPIGGLALSDLSNQSPKRAVKIVRDALDGAAPLKALKGRTFYAVGGTWRALAKLHMSQRDYPLHVMQGYVIPAQAGLFANLIERTEPDAAVSIAAVSAARRPLLAYGAVVLDEIVRLARPREIVISTLGVREGMLFEHLDPAERAVDPLLAAAGELNTLRSRSPGHGPDLCAWTDAILATSEIEETPGQRRLRHAACLLSDTSWRAHPDYRSIQAFSTIANAGFVGVDHPGRGFLALAINYRYEGLDGSIDTQLQSLLTTDEAERAKLLGAAMRVAYQLSCAIGGALPRLPVRCSRGKVVLTLPEPERDLASVRLQNRLRQLARLLGREPDIKVGTDA